MESLLVSATLAGLAVVAVTWIAARVGGTMGGLLATAPVTSAAAIVVLAIETGNQTTGANLLEGGKSLFAALVGMPVYFFVLKWTRGLRLWLRLATAILTYVLVFTGGTLLIHAITPATLAPLWLLASLLVAGVLGVTFLRVQLPPMHAHPPRGRFTWQEVALRFSAGAGVILLVGLLRSAMPGLSAAWAIFPATFIVSLWLLGKANGAAFSARASQGGVLGVPPVVAYLMVLWAVLPLHQGLAWTWLSQAPAWMAYFAVLMIVRRVRIGSTEPSPTRSSA